MAKFKNTILGRIAGGKIVNALTGGISGSVMAVVGGVGKSGTKASNKKITAPVAKIATSPTSATPAQKIVTPSSITNQKNESMLEKLKLFASENWKMLVPAVVLIPVAIWFFFFRNKKRVTRR